MNPALYNKLTYDPNELAPIGLVGAAYFVMVANRRCRRKRFRN